MFASHKPKNHVKLPFENERLPVDVLNKKSRPLSYFLITSGCDELTRKIKNSKNSLKSFLNTMGYRKLLIVRAGSDNRIHKDSDEFSLDLLAEKKCEELLRMSQLAISSSLFFALLIPSEMLVYSINLKTIC